MAFQANLGVSIAVYTPDVSPASGMRVDTAGTVTLDADIPVGMAGLTRLQVTSRFGGVL